MEAMSKSAVASVWLLCAGLMLSFAGPTKAVDFPHSTIGGTGCDYCHFPHSTRPNLLPEQYQHTPQDVDDTPANNLCRSCHNDINAPLMEPHSNLTTNAKYGNWGVPNLPGPTQ